MLRLLATLTLIFVAHAANAEWTSVNKVDDFTDKETKHAAFSDSEHRIQLSREGKAVWMFITRKKLGTFEPNGLIELRVDKNEVRVIDPVKSKQLAETLGRQTFKWEPATVGFLLWHGAEDKGCGYVIELLQGHELKVRYQTNSLERETFDVSLNGAKQAIIDGLGLTKCVH